ncbi:toll/interleukin-1 receptor domain-containing protein [Rhodococcus sp. IEGM 1379]|uniref:toll/interleukin-1 receptor domain-containing protein n=1 Tax=Rhodococcus sp. IEGM 1379 TaxID=3047086 RepID=UPI0024B69C7E|nr:toll/interleukin-1 receptor domain-containing protein [Rhodococcus sp. IEGM 1379]MDI9916909.1 toll/interleukin-1 receptor domain-containing protein [Rhodococcus sp. IEGM 1379]
MTTANTEQPSGFWSYVHDDNDGEGGRILRLCELVQKEFGSLTARSIEMFVDRKDIAWGAKWKITIDDALTETTFFIAIVTPRYLKSEQCRREILLFTQNAQERKVPELLLPILYFPVDDLVEESTDKVRSAIAAAQYERFDQLRLEDEDSKPYRTAVNKLALRLIDIATEVASRPEIIPSATAKTAASDDSPDDEYDDSPGLIDAIASAEELFPAWQGTIEQFSVIMNQISDVTNRYAPIMSKASDRNAAAKLFVAKNYANELMPIAEEFRDNGLQYAEQAMSMNENIVTVLSQIASRPPAERKDESVLDFMNQVRTLSEAGRSAISSVEGFQENVRDVAKLSRDVRRPLVIISKGAQSFIDGQQFFNEWERRINDIENNPDGIIAES